MSQSGGCSFSFVEIVLIDRLLITEVSHPQMGRDGHKKMILPEKFRLSVARFYTKLKEVLGCCIRHLIDGDNFKFKIY